MNEDAASNSGGRPARGKRQPRLIAGRRGRLISLAGLVERIVSQYAHEHNEAAPDDPLERRKRVREIAEYIFHQESVQLSPSEQAHIIRWAHGELFGYGPLDALLDDETITTITLEGPDKVAVRRGPGQELSAVEPIFEDHQHMQRILKRLLADADAEIRPDEPIIEVGLAHGDLRLGINLSAPPAVLETSADIRVHRAPPTLAQWVEAGTMSPDAATLLEAIAHSEHGCVIVGDTESGKTTLLATLAAYLTPEDVLAVERAGELYLPEGTRRLSAQWPVGEREGVTFGARIAEGLSQGAPIMLLDEVRADEPHTIAPLLQAEHAPRQIWAFRGGADAKRILSALGIVARMADPAQPEAMARTLYQRLPFVVILKRRKNRLELRGIAEWQYPDATSEHPDFVELMALGGAGLEKTGHQPQHALTLPEAFWM